MVIPNTLPMTANVPTAMTAAPTPAAAEAPHSWRTPVGSCLPSSPKVVTTSASTTATAIPAWTNTLSRSPRRTATIPAAPPKNTNAVISTEPAFTAPATIAITAVSIIAVPASSRRAARIPTAAVGTMYGIAARPAVTSRANVANTSINPTRVRTLFRCHSSGRKRQIQASTSPTRSVEKSAQPASLAKSHSAVLRPNAATASTVSAVIGSPLRTIAWPWVSETSTGGTLLGGPTLGRISLGLIEVGVRDEERRHDLGGELALGLV